MSVEGDVFIPPMEFKDKEELLWRLVVAQSLYHKITIFCVYV